MHWFLFFSLQFIRLANNNKPNKNFNLTVKVLRYHEDHSNTGHIFCCPLLHRDPC